MWCIQVPVSLAVNIGLITWSKFPLSVPMSLVLLVYLFTFHLETVLSLPCLVIVPLTCSVFYISSVQISSIVIKHFWALFLCYFQFPKLYLPYYFVYGSPFADVVYMCVVYMYVELHFEPWQWFLIAPNTNTLSLCTCALLHQPICYC